MASTVFKGNNGNIVRFNKTSYLAAQAGKLVIKIPAALDTGLVMVRLKINGAYPGGVILLNIGYASAVLAQQWHNMQDTVGISATGIGSDGYVTLTLTSSTFTASQTVNVRIIQFNEPNI